MKETNFYPGIYKIIAVIVCLMLYAAINSSHACGRTVTKQQDIKKTILLTHKP